MTTQTAARAAGVLYLVSYVGFIAGSGLAFAALDPASTLEGIRASQSQITLGVVLQFVNVAAILGFSALLYPQLKKHGEGVALWYVGSRILEGAAYVVSMISTLSLVSVSAAESSTEESFAVAQLVTIGTISGATLIATIALLVGAVALYGLLYRSRLVPRFISVWGLGAVVLLALGNVLLPSGPTELSPAALLYAPMPLNELFLAVWLIVKGLRATITSDAVPSSRSGALG